jgi:trigger factor
MHVQVNKLSPVLVEFDVEVAADRVTSEIDKAYTAFGRSAKIRGFRPGKAPRRVLAHVLGARIAADVAERLVQETFPQAVANNNLQPVTSPAIEPQKVEANKPFTYKARFEIIPAIESVSYEALGAKRPKVVVTKEQIRAELERLQREHSTLEPPKEPRAARKGDQVTIDFTIRVDGKPVEDAGSTDFSVELGAGVLLGPIEEALLGKKPGESVEATVDMPATHPHPKLKGKTATFALTLKDLKERVLPAIDDELAKDVGEFETLADLEKDIEKKLEKVAKENSDNAVAEQLVVELVKANPIPLPPSLVERQVKLTEQELLSQARRRGQAVTELGDELRQKILADAEIKVRAGLLMAEIAKKEGIKIGDAEIEEGLAELAEQSGKNVAKLRAEYRDAKRREMLIGMILENKVLDIIEAKAKIEEET